MNDAARSYAEDAAWPRERDRRDPLRRFRDRFLLPRNRDGSPKVYLCGNSLGLQPRGARSMIERELVDWAALAVDAHFDGRTPWFSYHEVFRESGASIVGANPGEVVMMNGLTTNLHLMMVSFYRPTSRRFRVLVEPAAFPSDHYAVVSQIRHHGFDPEDALVVLEPRPGESTLRTEDILATIEREGDRLALVMLGGVQYYTGQWFDMEAITPAGHAVGAAVGFDLAHAAGNVPLALHDWDVDFAVWCSYKYLNSGPGGIAGCFVHERHGADAGIPRFAGWWGNEPESRFRMHLERAFVPRRGADGWQLSNPPIFAMAPLRASLELFEQAGMEALRAKSLELTGYLEFLLDRFMPEGIEILTPRDPGARGCQLSLAVRDGARAAEGRVATPAIFERLAARGFVVDFRPPDVVRAAPVPLYNTFEDVYRFATAWVEETERASRGSSA